MGLVSVYYPREGHPTTLAMDYPISPGGLAFHGKESRLDKLVQNGLLRKVETDKLDLPNGIHVLDIPYERWLDGGFQPSIRSVSFDDPTVGTINPQAGFVETPALRAMKGEEITEARAAALPSRVVATPKPPPPFAQPPRPPVPTVDPTTGAQIMAAEGPAPDLAAELDPEFVASVPEHAHLEARPLTLDEANQLTDPDLVKMAADRGFKGSNRNRALAFLVDRGAIKNEEKR